MVQVKAHGVSSQGGWESTIGRICEMGRFWVRNEKMS